jgi:hypothetical protein
MWNMHVARFPLMQACWCNLHSSPCLHRHSAWQQLQHHPLQRSRFYCAMDAVTPLECRWTGAVSKMAGVAAITSAATSSAKKTLKDFAMEPGRRLPFMPTRKAANGAADSSQPHMSVVPAHVTRDGDSDTSLQVPTSPGSTASRRRMSFMPGSRRTGDISEGSSPTKGKPRRMSFMPGMRHPVDSGEGCSGSGVFRRMSFMPVDRKPGDVSSNTDVLPSAAGGGARSVSSLLDMRQPSSGEVDGGGGGQAVAPASPKEGGSRPTLEGRDASSSFAGHAPLSSKSALSVCTCVEVVDAQESDASGMARVWHHAALVIESVYVNEST